MNYLTVVEVAGDDGTFAVPPERQRGLLAALALEAGRALSTHALADRLCEWPPASAVH